MALILVLGSMTAAFAATTGGESGGTPTTPTKELGDFEVTGYEIKIAGVDKEINSITKGSEVDITLKMKYNGTFDSSLTAATLDVTRRVDSFSGGVINKGETVQTSQDRENFAFQVIVRSLTYKGTGQTLKVMVKKGANEYQNIDVPISECKEYTEPKVEPTPTPTPTPEAIPAPKVIVTRNELGGDVKAGDELMLTVSVFFIVAAFCLSVSIFVLSIFFLLCSSISLCTV